MPIGARSCTHPGRITTADGTVPRVFSAFWRRWQERGLPTVEGPGHARPRSRSLDRRRSRTAPSRRPIRATRLDEFVAEHLADYPEQRDLPSVDGTSQLSIALKTGTLGPATAARIAADAGPRGDPWIRQLCWRDWYAHLLAEQPRLVDHAQRPEYDRIAWRDDPDGLAAWQEGRTGVPIVDAGMRQLAATGWMHNRVRMITASFLVKDLLVDWRLGERHFRHLLADGDVPQNVGNWQWVAGTGPDAAPYFRVFNPTLQSRKFDPGGEYLRRWVPELAGLDDTAIHEPCDASARSSSPPRASPSATTTRTRSSTTRWPGTAPSPPTRPPAEPLTRRPVRSVPHARPGIVGGPGSAALRASMRRRSRAQWYRSKRRITRSRCSSSPSRSSRGVGPDAVIAPDDDDVGELLVQGREPCRVGRVLHPQHEVASDEAHRVVVRVEAACTRRPRRRRRR